MYYSQIADFFSLLIYIMGEFIFDVAIDLEKKMTRTRYYSANKDNNKRQEKLEI